MIKISEVGIDEAGRGPLAGPVVAAAVFLAGFQETQILRDSKKLSEKQRREIYNKLIRCSKVKWGIGIVSEKVIDKINILEAAKLAMVKSVNNLKKKNKNQKIDLLIIDGKIRLALPFSQKQMVKADEKIFSCMAASIIAKVSRDRIMVNYHKKYPRYGFDRHKGYPTDLHVKVLKRYGRCAIHRKSFNYGSTKTKKNKIKAGTKENAPLS